MFISFFMGHILNIQGINEVRPSDERTVVPILVVKKLKSLEMCVSRRHVTVSSDRKTSMLSIIFVIFGKAKLFRFGVNLSCDVVPT